MTKQQLKYDNLMTKQQKNKLMIWDEIAPIRRNQDTLHNWAESLAESRERDNEIIPYSFHIDHYQVMFVSPLYDSPGSWNKTPPCPSHCLSQSFQELHTLFCAIPLDASPFAKPPQISSLTLHFPVFWEHSHFQQ